MQKTGLKPEEKTTKNPVKEGYLPDWDDDFYEDDGKDTCPRELRDVIQCFKSYLVTVEFECADCCKKATGILRCIGDNYILLDHTNDRFVAVQVFGREMKEPIIDCARKIVIQLDKIVSVEMAVEQDFQCL